MTISSQTRKAGPFTGNGTNTSFPFTFKVFQASDLVVVRTDLSAVESTLTLGTDYTVTLNSNQNSNPGGTVNTTSAPASGFLITLTSSVAYTQAVDLTNQGGFYPSVINDALDKATIQIQQLNEQVGRAVKTNISSSQTPDELINTVITSAAAASTSASEAESSATAAATSATNAATSATNAATSATNAASSATTAAGYIGNIINNPILGDDVFSGNGSTTVFTLSRSVTASTETALLITIGGVVQAPTAAYSASGTTLTFTSAPPSGTNNIRVRYIGALAVDAALAQTAATQAVAAAASAGGAEIVFTIDGLGAAPSAGSKGFLEIPFNCTINSWTLLSDVAGSITVDIKKSTYSGFPTTTSITASATPALATAQKAQSSTLTGWTTTLTAGDILEYVVTGTPATLTRATINLKVTRT